MTNTSKTRQQGGAALLVVAVLAIVMAAMTLTTTNVGVMEQRSVGNDLRAKEAREAAEAGLEYGIAWVRNNPITWAAGTTVLNCTPESTPSGCPTSLPTISNTETSTQESYSISLKYEKFPQFVRITSSASGASDTNIKATVTSTFKAPPELFDPGAPSPPPFVLAGCMEGPTGTSDIYLLDSTHEAAITGSTPDASCLPQAKSGSGLDVYTWNDANDNNIKESAEEGGSASYDRDDFTGCPGAQCAWNHVFKMSLNDAKQMAVSAGHLYPSDIPCGPPASPPSIYVVTNGGPINSGDISCAGKTIGGPNDPVVLIFDGCVKIGGGITIFGIVYMEPDSNCVGNGWGGAKLYGSVIWENDNGTSDPDVGKPSANSEFIEVDWEDMGDLNDVFKITGDMANIPGTWKDW